MTSAIGWFGPLIDLSRAASHVGDLVQLIVFVHRSSPVQYKLSRGGEAIRTDIQVGDDTRPFFSVSLWQKQLGSLAVAGDVILLQNVKIIKFGDIVEAKTVQYSSLQPLIHPYESLVSKGINALLVGCKVGKTLKEKLLKVIEWVQRTKSLRRNNFHSSQYQLSRNWKEPEERKPVDCFSLPEVLRLTSSFNAIFNASIGEIFLPITWRTLGEAENEMMFISRRLSKMEDNDLVEDLICTGCQLCGSPLDLECGSKFEQNTIPLCCGRSSNRVHVVSMIYRPFMLYVWDELEYMPLLVRNKAAEFLFGNIRAERVYRCYKGKSCIQYPGQGDATQENCCNLKATDHPEFTGDMRYPSLEADKSLQVMEKTQRDKNMNFYLIWLILLKMMLKRGRNSPLKFEVAVNTSLDIENGRFEMVSVSTPCVSSNCTIK